MDAIEKMTVVELKQHLKERGLAVSGKKSDLIQRLVDNNGKGKLAPKEQDDQELPPLKSILQNGFSSVHFDLKIVYRYSATFLMMIFLIIGLNSNSWYFMEVTSTDGEPEMAIYVEEKTTLNFGIDEIEIVYEADGIVWGGPVDQELSETIGYEGGECSRTDEFDCDSFINGGNLIQLSFWIAIISMMILFALGISKGFGKDLVQSMDLQKHEKMISEILWGIVTFLPIIGIICYGFIVGLSEMDLSDWDDNGFGSIWWNILVISLLFTSLIYKENISSLITKIKQNN